MRALAGLVVALGLVAASTTARAGSSDDDDDRPAKPAPAVKHKKQKRGTPAPSGSAASSSSGHTKPDKRRTTTKTRVARISTLRAHDRLELRGSAIGQSIGMPWQGRLQHPSQLPPGDGYFIRHPQRVFGTATTVDYIQRAIGETLDAFPDEHTLAIGDISAESGGRITDHRSHQSGRDADIGLFYNEQPSGYPDGFIHANADNLDCAATFKLLERFLATADEDGGVQMIFLDFDVQGLLYDWALDHGVSERRLERIFQYPHGRGSSEGIVRHEPNHDNHMHVRFQCASSDSACQ